MDEKIKKYLADIQFHQVSFATLIKFQGRKFQAR